MGRTTDGWLSELGLAVRLVVRRPKHAIAVVVLTAMGMSAFTAVFAVADTILLDPPPYPVPERLVMSWNTFRSSGLGRLPLSYAQIEALAGSPAFEAVAGIWVSSAVIGTPEGYRNVTSAHVTADLQEVLGLDASLGRVLAPEEFGRGAISALMISDQLWRTEFAAGEVIGKPIRVDGGSATIVGVLPAGFSFVLPADSNVPPHVDVVLPLRSPPGEMPVAQFFLRTLARLAPGTTLA
jgi:putative ABC transport system permease protein